jgi:uncharacterized membrane protein YkvA (DUF1232 family)
MDDPNKVGKRGPDIGIQTRDEPAEKPTVWIYLSAFVGLVYLLNPTFGILELIPDNLPVIGNLDEGAAAILVWQGIKGIMQTRKPH